MEKIDLFASVVGCWPPNGNCTVDWDAWAAIFTALAIVLGAIGLWLESKRAARIQSAEWRRQERVRRRDLAERRAAEEERAAVIAMVANKEMWRARCELVALKKFLSGMQEEHFDDFCAVYKNGLRNRFQIMPMVLEYPAAFDAMDLVHITNAVAIWDDVPLVGQPLISTLQYSTLIALRPTIIEACDTLIGIYADASARLQRHTTRIPGVEVINAEDILAMGARAAAMKAEAERQAQAEAPSPS